MANMVGTYLQIQATNVPMQRVYNLSLQGKRCPTHRANVPTETSLVC